MQRYNHAVCINASVHACRAAFTCYALVNEREHACSVAYMGYALINVQILIL